MKIWKIGRSRYVGYDEYDSAVVAAETEREARETNPGGEHLAFVGGRWRYADGSVSDYSGWTHPDEITVTYIGEAVSDTPAGVILASFNAG